MIKHDEKRETTRSLSRANARAESRVARQPVAFGDTRSFISSLPPFFLFLSKIHSQERSFAHARNYSAISAGVRRGFMPLRQQKKCVATRSSHDESERNRVYNPEGQFPVLQRRLSPPDVRARVRLLSNRSELKKPRAGDFSARSDSRANQLGATK